MKNDLSVMKGISFANTYYLNIRLRPSDVELVIKKENSRESGLYADMQLTLMND